MDNYFRLTAVLKKSEMLRYTPAGVPVLDVVLRHESMQVENGVGRKVKFELPAKMVGQNALLWQSREGTAAIFCGFLAQKNQRHFSPLLHIQEIIEI